MAKMAKGTRLLVGDGAVAPAVEAYAPVAELTSIPLPEFGTGTVDVTNHDSTSEEFISDGIQQHGEFEAEGNWLLDHATHDEETGLLAIARSGEAHNFKIEVPIAGAQKLVMPFRAFVKFKPMAGGPKDPLKFKVSFRPTGAIVPAAAA